jgi:hypothetical protein
MSNFKISPLVQGKPAVPRRWWLSRFLLLIMAIETMAFSYWIFRFNAQITEFKRQISSIQASENKERLCTAINF